MKSKVSIALLCGTVLAISGPTAGLAAPEHPQRQRVLVYSVRRPGLSVSITRRGDRIIRAAVGAPGLCDNGERQGVGFELVGGSGIRVHPNGVFDDRRGTDRYLKGRFEDDKVVGYFRDSYIQDVSGEEPPVTCGNLAPRGRNQRFVARLAHG